MIKKINLTPHIHMASVASVGQFPEWYVLIDPVAQIARVQHRPYCNRGDVLAAVYVHGHNILPCAVVINNEYNDLASTNWYFVADNNQVMLVNHLREETRLTEQYAQCILDTMAMVDWSLYSIVRHNYTNTDESRGEDFLYEQIRHWEEFYGLATQAAPNPPVTIPTPLVIVLYLSCMTTDFIADLLEQTECSLDSWAEISPRGGYWMRETEASSDGPRVEFELNKELIVKGLGVVLADGFAINDAIRESLVAAVQENDASYVDVDGADAIVQAAVFGEIVYG